MKRGAWKFAALIVFFFCLTIPVLAAGDVIIVTNSNGDVVTLLLSGDGSMSVSLVNGELGPVDRVVLADTTTKTTLAINVQKSKTGTGIATINSIVGNGSLKQLSAKKVDIIGDGITMAGSIGQLTLNNLTNTIVTIAGASVPQGDYTLKKFNCKEMFGSRIQANGIVKTVTIGRMIDSALWVGYVPNDVSDPLAGGMFSDKGTITSVNVKGTGTSGPAFLNSSIGAVNMGTVSLASVNTNNLGVAFGVVASTFNKAISVKSPKFKRDKNGPVLLALGDFTVRQLFSPVAYTDAAVGITSDSATLTGTINPNGLPTAAYFEWGTNIVYDQSTSLELVGGGTNLVNYQTILTGLTPGTTYHYRILAVNNNGTVSGGDQMFLATPPVVTTDNMVLIPAGPFLMGDALNEGSVTETPVHAVYISAFFMDQTEVSRALWDEVLNWAVGHGYTFEKSGLSSGPDHPICWISWYDCIKWCNARSEMNGLTPCYYTNPVQTNVYREGEKTITNSCVNWSANGYRLPTEAEWEKAARGGFRGLRFPWGTTIAHTQANYYSLDTFPYDISLTRYYNPLYYSGIAPYTSPVGSFQPNGYGLYDMAGNVWEWCWDWNLYLWYQGPAASEPDPIGPTTGKERLVRGGGWFSTAYNCRVSFRDYFLKPTEAVSSIGFRTVRR
jgi:formylglycine-generating enzyme